MTGFRSCDCDSFWLYSGLEMDRAVKMIVIRTVKLPELLISTGIKITISGKSTYGTTFCALNTSFVIRACSVKENSKRLESLHVGRWKKVK